LPTLVFFPSYHIGLLEYKSQPPTSPPVYNSPPTSLLGSIRLCTVFYVLHLSCLVCHSFRFQVDRLFFNQCCGSGMFIPNPYFFPSPDLGSRNQQQQKRGGGKMCCLTFFCSHKFHKIENFLTFSMTERCSTPVAANIITSFKCIFFSLAYRLFLAFRLY
jgi:hypothetical protein